VSLKDPVECPSCGNHNTCASNLSDVLVCVDCGLIWEPNDEAKGCSQQGVSSLEQVTCPVCQGLDTAPKVEGCMVKENCHVCFTCRTTFYDSIGEEEEEIDGTILICPHCAEIDSIQAFGGVEYCDECGLDPGDLDQDSAAIARLYKGSLREKLSQNIGLLGPTRLLGQFVRQHCGPHCISAKSCPQKASELIKCFRKDSSNLREGIDPMGRGKNGKKGKGQQQQPQGRFSRLRNRCSTYRAPEVAFACSKGGLLEKMVLHDASDSDKKHSGNTGSQSGA
jgi:hypothetical protein